jgi:hypothetical protein
MPVAGIGRDWTIELPSCCGEQPQSGDIECCSPVHTPSNAFMFFTSLAGRPPSLHLNRKGPTIKQSALIRGVYPSSQRTCAPYGNA